MNTIPAMRKAESMPRFVHDPSFDERTAAKLYLADDAADPAQFEKSYMPDEVTRDTAKRMHYAAYRANKARSGADARRWKQVYYDLRDQVVLGNRKLVYRAVRRRMAMSNQADDLIGDCHIVLIHAVAAFNPWMGIRFSTYAFTCLIRALSRLSQRAANDWFSRSAPLEALPDGEAAQGFEPELASSSFFRIDEFLRNDHPLLSTREKIVISRRFQLSDGLPCPTLENVGRELGLSKERVRQVQACALGKLRQVLMADVNVG